MRVGLARRILSYILDAMPLIGVIVLMHSLFVGDIIANSIPNYEELSTVYYEQYDVLLDDTEELQIAYGEGLLTEEEYNEDLIALNKEFTENYPDELGAVETYFAITVLYGIITYLVTYYAYMLFTKGNTLGRRLMNAELVGNVKWYTLFIREVLWKHVFWLVFFVIGNYSGVLAILAISMIIGILIDVIMIGFTSKKMTLRDNLSNTQVVYKGVNYPF
jgi:hypothetical protein